MTINGDLLTNIALVRPGMKSVMQNASALSPAYAVDSVIVSDCLPHQEWKL
jgi:hypothetical protein